MPTLQAEDIQRMRDQLFFEGPERRRRTSRFWLLLLLSAVIATAGVMGDSTATVIGAMIVAPLMTPILGIVVAIALADHVNLGRSVLFVVTGAAAVIVIAFLFGMTAPTDLVAQTNGQIAARVSPGVIDLVAALATGAVGAVALARSDISDTLPGVAIAISLVPPLAVVGLTAESGAWDQSGGALLLFLANVSAILASGIVVMAIYRVRSQAAGATEATVHRGRAVIVIAAMVVIVLFPLVATTLHTTRTRTTEQDVRVAADRWASGRGWTVETVAAQGDHVLVRATGPAPEPDPRTLQADLVAAGQGGVAVRVELFPTRVTEFGG